MPYIDLQEQAIRAKALRAKPIIEPEDDSGLMALVGGAGDIGAGFIQGKADKEAKYEEDARKSALEKELAKLKGASAMTPYQMFSIQDKHQQRQERAQEKEDKLQVPGLAMLGTVKPSEKEAKDLRGGVETLNNLRSNLNRYDQLVQQHGSFELFGQGSTEMESIASDTLVQLKELAKLGALSGPDLGLVQQQISSPTSFKALFTRDATARAQIQQILRNAENRLSSGAASRGYAPLPGTLQRLEQDVASGKSQPNLVGGAKTQRTALDPASQQREALVRRQQELLQKQGARK